MLDKARELFKSEGITNNFKVVRMRLEEGRRIVGTLIPTSAMDTLVRTLKSGAESHNTEIQEITIEDDD